MIDIRLVALTVSDINVYDLIGLLCGWVNSNRHVEVGSSSLMKHRMKV